MNDLTVSQSEWNQSLGTDGHTVSPNYTTQREHLAHAYYTSPSNQAPPPSEEETVMSLIPQPGQRMSQPEEMDTTTAPITTPPPSRESKSSEQAMPVNDLTVSQSERDQSLGTDGHTVCPD